MAKQELSYPLVSVIVTCYNQENFLEDAVSSIQSQSYPAVEIIVVDDGSTDNSREAAEKFESVKYIYQTNQGVCAARNNGILNSRGDYLVFLDADDWFLPGAIETNAAYLIQDKNLGFVSGAHDKIFVKEGIIKEEVMEVTSDHYIRLLQGNFIGMFAAAMFRREIFKEIQFDSTLKHCQDYDVFLRAARKYKVFHHTRKVAAYRLHTSNKSSNTTAMLSYALKVLERQHKVLRTPAEVEAYKKGRQKWKQYYCKELYMKLLTQNTRLSTDAFYTILQNRPALLLKYLLVQYSHKLRHPLDKYAPAFYLRWLRQVDLYRHTRKL